MLNEAIALMSIYLFLILVKHASSVHHLNYSKIQQVDGSLSDSDSAFFTNDASENRLANQNFQYLNHYVKFLAKESDSEGNSRRLLKQTLAHLEVLMSVAGSSTK
jgi:hypothetical protein